VASVETSEWEVWVEYVIHECLPRGAQLDALRRVGFVVFAGRCLPRFKLLSRRTRRVWKSRVRAGLDVVVRRHGRLLFCVVELRSEVLLWVRDARAAEYFLKFPDMSFGRAPDVAAGYDLSMATVLSLLFCIGPPAVRSLDV
jgi:hypothetical protein